MLYYANADKDNADVFILGIPFDSTTTFNPGSRFGPDAIRQVTDVLESYSMILDKDIIDIKVCDLGNISHYSNPKFMINETYNKVKEILNKNKFIVCLGGEHTITYPVVKAYKEKFENLAVIQFDAHSDLRENFEFEKFSHACVMNLIGKEIGFENLYQFGIRSMDKEELKFAKKTNFYPLHKYKSKDIIKILNNLNLKEKEIYLTIDIDVLDPSCAPGTGTPEPCGLTTNEFFEIFYELRKFNIVGMDIVEINPMIDISGITAITGAKILREGILSFVKY
ncbi:MAG: agmatinase [Candidatus Altarchaeaceae archaeon]